MDGHDIGTTSGGTVSIELLPLNYPFSMDYAYARKEMSQNAGTNPTVMFKPDKCILHWHMYRTTRVDGMRLPIDMESLPSTYPFTFSDIPQASYPVVAGTVNNIH